MFRHALRALCALLPIAALACTVPAQGQTWIVDQNNGPGTHFTDIPPALQAARDGDTILVRAGFYGGGTIDKGLALLAEPGAAVYISTLASTAFVVQNLTTQQSVVIQGISTWLSGFTDTFLDVRNCAGRVHVDRLSIDFPVDPTILRYGIRIVACDHVSIHASTILQGLPLHVLSSTVVVTDSTLEGADDFGGIRSMVTAPGIYVAGGSLTLSRTDVEGGEGPFWDPRPSEPAIHATLGAVLEITGSAGTRLAAGSFAQWGPAPAIGGSGAVIALDPRVSLVPSGGGPAVAPQQQVRIELIPGMSATGAPPGGTVRYDLLATAGDLAEIYLSLPFGPALLIPTWGNLWVDPSALLVLGRFNVPASHTVGGSFAMPPLAALRGVPVTFQAFTASSIRGFRLSTPVTAVLH